MNCGRNARKKIDSFGLRMLIRNPVTITRSAGASIDARIDRERPSLAQHLPGHVQEIDHPAPFQRRERQRAGVQHRGKPEHGGGHCGTIPSVQPNAAAMLARDPCVSAAASV